MPVRWFVVIAALALLGASCDGQRPAGGGTDATSSASDPGTTAATLAVEVGSDGIGDPYFPKLGNGGYDVEHYDLDLTVDPTANRLLSVATISATVTTAGPLGLLDLDLHGLDVASVLIDGGGVRFERDGDELIVHPALPLAPGAQFTATVVYEGEPEPIVSEAIPIEVGWIKTAGGSFVLSEPEGASTWYPANDHPLDKATFTFRITVPDGIEAVANGDLVNQQPTGHGTTQWTWDERAPMAPYLATVAVGQYRIVTEPGPAGITIRHAFADRLADDATFDFGRTGEMLDLFAADFGPYPFDVYGGLVVDQRNGYALEDQTLSVFDASFVDGRRGSEVILAHELVHQWFGDSVAVARWQDIWLSEGFATYGEWLWLEHADGTAPLDSARNAHDRLRENPALAPPPPGDPGVADLFAPTVYLRGALTLEALRLTVGDDVFFRTLRTYAARYRGANATTDDFVAVAQAVSGQDLGALFQAWLFAPDLPDLPK